MFPLFSESPNRLYQKSLIWFMTKWHFSLYVCSHLHNCKMICIHKETYLILTRTLIETESRIYHILISPLESWNAIGKFWLHKLDLVCQRETSTVVCQIKNKSLVRLSHKHPTQLFFTKGITVFHCSILFGFSISTY